MSRPEVWDAYWKKFSSAHVAVDPLHKEVMKMLPRSKASRILEAGCGTGKWTRYLHDKGYHGAIGVDFSKEAVAEARKGAPSIVGDIRKLPFASNSFDAVLSFGVVEHFTEPQMLVDEMFRVTKTGGRLFLDTPNFLCFHPVSRYVRQKKGTWHAGFELSYTPFSLASILERSGFAVEKAGTRHLSATLYPLAKLFGRKIAARVATRFEESRYNIFGMLSFVVGRKP